MVISLLRLLCQGNDMSMSSEGFQCLSAAAVYDVPGTPNMMGPKLTQDVWNSFYSSHSNLPIWNPRSYLCQSLVMIEPSKIREDWGSHSQDSQDILHIDILRLLNEAFSSKALKRRNGRSLRSWGHGVFVEVGKQKEDGLWTWWVAYVAGSLRVIRSLKFFFLPSSKVWTLRLVRCCCLDSQGSQLFAPRG